MKEGEYQRSSGTYEFKWRDKRGGRHSISAVTLEELREKELDVLRDVLDGVRADKNNLTINDLYNSWVQLKRGLKDNTFSNYKYMYTMFVEPDFGKSRIVDLKRSDVRGFIIIWRMKEIYRLIQSTVFILYCIPNLSAKSFNV